MEDESIKLNEQPQKRPQKQQQGTKRKKEKKEKVKVDHSIPLREQPTDEEKQQHPFCQHWQVFKHKHRAYFCNIPKVAQSNYCTIHIPMDAYNENETDPSKKRIPCPLNPTHFIFESKLKKHLKGCPDTKGTPKTAHFAVATKQVYYQENMNGQPPQFNTTPLSHLTTLQLHQLADKLDKLFEIYFPNGIQLNNHKHSSFDNVSKVSSTKKIKHIEQESSILSVLDQEGQLNKDYIYIEFGAGSAKLGYHVFNALDKQSGHIEIDRMRFKSLKRVDRLIKHEKTCSFFERCLIDIRHLNLSKLSILESKQFSVISKHLCGCATDFTLLCLYNSFKENLKLKSNFNGIGIATCCHHLCTFNTYINPKYITEQLGLDEKEFNMFCSITGWASYDINKKEKKEKKNEDLKEDSSIASTTPILLEGVNYDTVFEKERKEELGYKAKRLLDYGRYLFIKENLNIDCKLQIYTHLSKENMLISGITTKN